MARTDLLQQASGAAGNFGTGNFTTSAFTPPNNSLLVVSLVMIENNGTTTDPRASISVTDNLGGHLTYTKTIDEVASPTTFPTATLQYVAPVVTGASMSLVISAGGTRTVGAWYVSVSAETGYDTGTPTGGTGHVSQNGGFTGPPTPINLTLSGAPAASSEVIAAIGMDKSATGVLEGSGWTEIHDAMFNSDWGGQETEARTGSTSTSVDWQDARSGGGALFNIAAVATEIRMAGAAAPIQGQQSTNRHPGRGPGRARFYQSPRSTDLASTIQADAGVAEVDQHSTTSAAGAKGGIGNGTAIAHPTTAATTTKGGQGSGNASTCAVTRCTGIKGGIGSGLASARNRTTNTTAKGATATGAVVQRSSTTAAKATTPTGTGLAAQHSTTSSTALKGGQGTGSPSARASTITAGRHQGIATAGIAVAHPATKVTAAKAATGTGRPTQHSTTTVFGAQVAAFTPAYVSIDGSASAGSQDGRTTGQATDNTATSTGELDGTLTGGTTYGTTTSSGNLG